MVAVLAAFVGGCLGPSLVGLRTLLSVNILSGYYPWTAAHGSDAAGHQACTGDTIDAAMPGIAQVRDALFSWHLASWQNIVAGGGPLSSVPDLGLLDPLSLPYFVLPLWLAPVFVVLLEFVAAIGGTYLFLRRLRLSRPASVLAGMVFAASGFMVMWTNWPQTRVAALIPPLFWAVERLVQRVRPTDAILVAVVVASMLLGGFPQITGYALYLASGYLIVRVIAIHRSRLRDCLPTVGLAAGGLILGVLLAMVQILPFLHFYHQENLSYRAGESTAGLPFAGLITLFAPNADGLCIAGPTPYRGTINPIELVAYVGSAALVLAIAGAAFGLARRGGDERGQRGYFVAATVIIIGLGWVSPSARHLVAHFPVFSNTFIGRIRSVLGFTLAVLAAIGFDWMTVRRGPNGKDKIGSRAWAAFVWVAAAGTGVLLVWRVHHVARAGGYWLAVFRAAWIPGVLLIAALLVVAMSRLRLRGVQVFVFLVVPLLVAAQGAQFLHTVLPGDNKKDFYPVAPSQRFLAWHLGPDRFTSSDQTMFPATALYYDLRTPTGHFFEEAAWESLLQRVDPSVMQSATNASFTAALNLTNVGDQPILDRMAVKYYVAQPTGLAGRALPLPAADGSVDAGSGSASCTLPSQPLRGVTVQLARPLEAANPQRGETLYVAVQDGGQTISSGRYMGASAAAGVPLSIALAGEDLPPGSNLEVTLSASGAGGPLVLAANGGVMACAAVTPEDDGLKLVYADPGAVIYQRLTALPRIRWASRTTVIANAGQRIAALAGGVPGDTVVLDSPGPAGSGQGAQVSVGTDSGDEITANVSAAGAGYLVVADAMQDSGWSVSVDGKPAKLVPADDAMVAVAVSAGTHHIAFHYRAPGQVMGAALSGLAVISIVVLLTWERRRDRSRPAHRAVRARQG
jgi:hypothetical protein